MIELDRVSMRLESGGRPVEILRAISLRIPRGQFVAIVGPSGSGKSTLLGLIAGLDRPTAGSIRIDGTEIDPLSEDDRARLRLRRIGFVFQSYHLILTLTALENVALPLELAGNPKARAQAAEWLAAVGLAERRGHYPAQLSGGEQQRVAVARAFAPRPDVLLADEPTGNLDHATGSGVIDLLVQLQRGQGSTLMLVTHDAALAARAERVVTLADGCMAADRLQGRT